MKVGIMSMQRIRNNGSYLQAYALYETVRKYGHDVEFVDFHDELHEKQQAARPARSLKNSLRKIKHTLIPKYRRILKAKKNSRRFVEKLPGYYPLLGMTDQLNDGAGKHYDLLISGSDEVFNLCQFPDGGAPIPWELLGEGISADRKISYAAACGQTDLEGIEKLGQTEHTASLLRQFDGLSVRDANTAEVVRTLTGKEPTYSIDPVLMYETFPEGEDYRKLNEPYLLVYAYTLRIQNPEEIAAVRAYARSRNLKIVCVNVCQSWCDETIIASPFALLQYIRDAQCVVTDTFHGTVFSIRNHTPFVTFVRSSNSNKLRFLLKQFDLSEREVQNPSELADVMDRPVNFDRAEELLAEKRREAREYLEQYLK